MSHPLSRVFTISFHHRARSCLDQTHIRHEWPAPSVPLNSAWQSRRKVPKESLFFTVGVHPGFTLSYLTVFFFFFKLWRGFLNDDSKPFQLICVELCLFSSLPSSSPAVGALTPQSGPGIVCLLDCPMSTSDIRVNQTGNADAERFLKRGGRGGHHFPQ